MPMVYSELRRLAGSYLRRERAGHTMQSTALVHEAYLRLINQREVQWKGRAHSYGIAAQTAGVMQLSPATVKREWSSARASLRQGLQIYDGLRARGAISAEYSEVPKRIAQELEECERLERQSDNS